MHKKRYQWNKKETTLSIVKENLEEFQHIPVAKAEVICYTKDPATKKQGIKKKKQKPKARKKVIFEN
jgi:hypothetical protein